MCRWLPTPVLKQRQGKWRLIVRQLLTVLVVRDGLLLEVLVELGPELPLQAVGVEAEEALEAVPEAGGGVLVGERPELAVHRPVEVVPQEERPEAEQRVHLLRLADAQLLALWKTESSSVSILFHEIPSSTKSMIHFVSRRVFVRKANHLLIRSKGLLNFFIWRSYSHKVMVSLMCYENSTYNKPKGV